MAIVARDLPRSGSAPLLGWLAWRRRRQDRARALWDAMCARLARAGLPRAAHEGPLAYVARAAARWPEFAAAFRVIGDAYAALRYGPVAAYADTSLERASALWRLKRAVGVLPAVARHCASRAGERPRASQQRVAIESPPL